MKVKLLTYSVALLAYMSSARGKFSNDTVTTGKSMELFHDKAADFPAQSEKKVRNVAACTLECQAQSACQSANALVLNDGQINCQVLTSSVPPDKLINAENSSYILPEISPSDCLEAISVYGNKSGVYSLLFPNKVINNVFCDQDTEGQGWLMILRRMDGSVNFFRNWASYKEGFGIPTGEFWLGLDKIYSLVSYGINTLRLDFWNDQDHIYAIYTGLTIANENDNYRIDWSTFEGNGGDSMKVSRTMQFSTYDRDNDVYSGSCAQGWRGAWWYKACKGAHPTGVYGALDQKGLHWTASHGGFYSFPNVEMKLRPGKFKLS